MKLTPGLEWINEAEISKFGKEKKIEEGHSNKKHFYGFLKNVHFPPNFHRKNSDSTDMYYKSTISTNNVCLQVSYIL